MNFKEEEKFAYAGGEFSGVFDVILEKNGELDFILIEAVRTLPNRFQPEKKIKYGRTK